MRCRKWAKKGVGLEETIPLIFFIMLMIFMLIIFKWWDSHKSEKIESTVNKERIAIGSHKALRDFAEIYHDRIIEAHHKDDYREFEQISREFFNKNLYTADFKGWRLEFRDSNERLKKKIVADPLTSISNAEIIFLHIPVQRSPETDFVALKLYIGE